HHADLPALRAAWPRGSGEGLVASELPTSDKRPAGAEVQEEERALVHANETPEPPPPPRHSRLGATLKDSFLGAVVAFVLFGPIVGLETVPGINNILALNQRWGVV